jgi:hypothetical protein
MESLRVTSCMAESADFIYRQITLYIAERLKIAAEFINDIPWQERERLLDESRSHSGFNLVRYHLARQGETWGYFGRVRASGAHQRSLQMILHHEADASAIDSTVMEMECQRDPGLLSYIRVIETLGPSPIPPWVIQKNLPREIKRELRELLLRMHTDPTGIRILTAGAIARFAAVEDTDYDTIRSMARQDVLRAEQITAVSNIQVGGKPYGAWWWND